MELLEATLALARAEGFHARSLHDPDLLRDPPQLVGRSTAELISLGVRRAAAAWLSDPDASVLAADRLWLEEQRLRMIAWGSLEYPGRLAAIADPPAVLFVRGDAANLLRPQLAIIGSRDPTPAGCRIAADFAAALAGVGLVISSGLARGIDAAAHEGALRRGRTLAVVGTGLDRVYPADNQSLHDRIVAAGGAIVSEFARGKPPLAPHFPQRNRVISAMSLGVLIVEAASRSGTLITARLAGDQGREVYAIPGSILNARAAGCHELIRQGAKLVESPEEILADIGLPFEKQDVAWETGAAPGARALDKDFEILLDGLGFDLVGVDELIARTGLCSQSLAQMLLTLELAGTVALHSGGRYQRVR